MPSIDSLRNSRGSGLASGQASGLAVGASGLAVGWQWVRPANQRITGVGERCRSPLALGGSQRPGCGTRRIYTELSRILDVCWPVCL